MSNLNHCHRSRLFLTIAEAANVWLATLSPITSKNYASGIKFLVSNGVIDLSMKLEASPIRDFGNATFYKIRDKVRTEFISKRE
uniref:Chlamydophila pneumoniae plasmid DNA n=1 Tax=Chlamydia pneumoniae TaxID=83558 RepID=Q46269_CHLPN|nr:unnamed protein product [Chlamydia pneumoniae]